MKSLLFLILSSSLFAAISPSAAWEVRTTGNATNGGGYSTGGTDMSLFDNKNASGCTSCQSATVNISTADFVTNNTTTVTSATANFSSALIGNMLYLSGTGTTTGWYEVTAVGGSTSITVDRATGSTGGTGVTGNIGGAQTYAGVLSAYVAGNTVWIKATATYTTTSNNFAVACTTTAPCLIRGYTSTRGDGGSATVQCTGNSCNALHLSGAQTYAENFIIDLNTRTSSRGLYVQGAGTSAYNVISTGGGSSSTGIAVAGTNTRVTKVAATTLGASCTAGISVATQSVVTDFYSSGNACPGVLVNGAIVTSLIRGIIAGNTSAGGHGVSITNTATVTIRNLTIHNNAGSGISCSTANGCDAITYWNNIFTNNGGYGIQSTSTVYLLSNSGFNAFYNNTSGARLNIPAGATDINTGSWAALPYTNAGGADYSLNSATEGASLKGTGAVALFLGSSTASYLDVGAAQSTGSGGGGGTVMH